MLTADPPQRMSIPLRWGRRAKDEVSMGLQENLLHETVADLTLRALVKVRPDQTLCHTCTAMREAKLGAAIVVNDQDRPIGMFNEKLLIKLLATQARPADLMDDPISKHMISDLPHIKESHSIAWLIATMKRHNLRWVCVVDDHGRAKALTGLRGVMEYVVEHFPRHIKVQPMRSKLAMDQREGA
jgi:CBS domain-containing protein